MTFDQDMKESNVYIPDIDIHVVKFGNKWCRIIVARKVFTNRQTDNDLLCEAG